MQIEIMQIDKLEFVGFLEELEFRVELYTKKRFKLSILV